MRIALGIRSLALPTMHWKLPPGRGGYALGIAGNYLLCCHSSVYVSSLRTLDSGEDSVDLSDFRAWILRKAPKLRFDPVYYRSFSWFIQPQAHWPVVVSS